MSEIGIAVLTYCPRGVTDHMASAKSAYCNLYGYDFITDEDCGMIGRASNWGKVNCVFRHFSKYDWVMYVDVNVGFANFTKSIERLINDLAKGRDALFCRSGSSMPETGAFLIRNCRAIIPFLKSWMSGRYFEMWNGGNYHERWVLNELAKGRFKKIIGFVKPLRIFNSLWHSSRNIIDEQYVIGDFILDGRGNPNVSSEAIKILKRNDDFVSGVSKVSRVELEKCNLREIKRRIGGCRMVFRKPIELKPEPEIDSVKTDEIKKDVPQRNSNLNYVEIKMDNGDEKVSIFTPRKFIPSGRMESSSGIGRKKNGWGFAYPNM